MLKKIELKKKIGKLNDRILDLYCREEISAVKPNDSSYKKL